MQEGYITMSTHEVEKLNVIRQVVEKRVKQKHAAKRLDITIRQIKRLVRKYKIHGPSGLVSKHRGKPGNNSYPEEFKEHINNIIREQYHDFGPTLACEKLKERNKIKLSVETTRKIMIRGGLWEPKKQKERVIHPPRLRRACYGELIQIDGSPHDWFEGRGPYCTLIVFIDDATSRIQFIRFFPAETTFAYFNVLKLYIERYGKPVELYSDRHGIFKVNIKEPKSGDGLTQFGRAVEELDIVVHHARSAPAKGRVERANKTLQDRLIKELRLRGISDIESANEFLDEYAKTHNDKFSIPPRDPMDVHKPLDKSTNLELVLTHKEERSVQKNLTIQYKNRIFAINVPGKGYRLRQAKVTVCEAESGEITLLHNGQSLSYTVYDKKQHYSEPVSAKEIITRALVKHHTVPHKPAANHPWNKQAIEASKRKELKNKGLIPRSPLKLVTNETSFDPIDGGWKKGITR